MKYELDRHPRAVPGRGRRVPRAAARRRLARLRRAARADPRRQAESPRRCSASALRTGTLDGQAHAGALRLVEEVPRRPAAARRRRATTCRRPPIGRRSRASSRRPRKTAERKPEPTEPFSAPGVQDRQREARRPGLPAHLLRRAEAGRRRS